MSHPLNELKRRLEDQTTPLPKRFRLAKNVAISDHFPTTPKERVIGEWLEDLTINKIITSKDFRDVLSWLNIVDDFTVELKYKLIKIVADYLNKNVIQDEDLPHIVAFIENPKMSPQLNIQIDNYLSITMNLLTHLTNSTNIPLVDKIFIHITKYYKECRKKFEFIIKILNEDYLETIFGYLDTENENNVLNLCQNVLFPINKRMFFARYLNNLVRKDSLQHLLEEKNDNMEAVIKVMDILLNFNKQQNKDSKFLTDFIKVFVSCFKAESQLLFAFYILVVNCLDMTQTYIHTVTKFTPIIFEENDEKIKRSIFESMLEILLSNEVDIYVNLRDTLNERSKETKKVFLTFLQDILIGTIKTQGKPDRTSLNIIKTGLKLDPSLIEQKVHEILPPIMVSKKSSSNIDAYSETINLLLQTLFKLSKGIDFIHKILPHLKNHLEQNDIKQGELRDKLNESITNNESGDKIKNRIVNGYDILPEGCVNMFGKLTLELMFRQNKDLLVVLQKDIEGCLAALEDGRSSPSIVTLTEMLSAILSSVLRHNKMADHTVPLPIDEDFWAVYQSFEDNCLKKFGECVLKSNDNTLLTSFLKLCISFTELKILNIKYSNIKLGFPEFENETDIYDLHSVLPCLSEQQWKEIACKVCNGETVSLLDNLLLAKTIALHLSMHKSENSNAIDEILTQTKTHLIKQLSNSNILNHDYFAKALFLNLDPNQLRQLAKCLVKIYENDQNIDIFKNDSVANHKGLLSSLVFEVTKNLTKCIENAPSLSKSVSKAGFDIIAFFKENDTKDYLNAISVDTDKTDKIIQYIEVLKHLQIFYLDENCQLTAIFVLMALKKCCNAKKVKRSIDHTLQGIFEISPKNPDIFQLFSVDFIFNFDNEILDLLKLSPKTSNYVLILRNVLETAVKKVKKDPELIKHIVEKLLGNFKRKIVKITDISDFNDGVFQIICLVLPLIAKEKKNIKTSAYRSVLANLQEQLNQAMLDSFRNVKFSGSLNTSNTDHSIVSDNTMAILNAMGAYTLTLLKCCETNDGSEMKSMDCLWSGMEFFIENAIQSIESPETKVLHVDLSMQLLNVTLRYIKKLESHKIFKHKDKLFLQIWRAVKSRLSLALDHRVKANNGVLEEIAVTLKFIAELSSIEFFANTIVADLNTLCILKKPSIILKNEEITSSQIISRNVLKYLSQNILKANIVEAKCVAFTKLIFRSTRNLRFWIQQHVQNGVDATVKVKDPVCELLRIDLDVLADVILAAKKITLDYKFIDAIFELQQLIHYILGRNSIDTRCIVSWQTFFTLFEGSVAILNNMILSREELLEDRWPCFMQCYKTLVLCMCERSTSQENVEKAIEHKLAEIAHSTEKLTQSISKRKSHVSRIAAYAVADLCSWLEKSPPPKIIRQHLENSIVLLIQASDSNYAMAFLRRGLAGTVGQMTLTNMYSMYKRYHKYVGNA